VASGSWSSLGLDSAYLELRLVDAESGDVVATRRAATADDASAVSVARTFVGSLVATLDSIGRLPSWTDPEAAAAPAAYRPAGVGQEAVSAFVHGLSSEDGWAWEEARRAYEQAIADEDGFFEARAALARTARLRNGGTLGES
jgi:hypothetical protein